MAFTQLSRSIMQEVKKQMVEHPYIIPLFVGCAFQSAIGIGTVGHTFKNKTDVIAARWRHYDRVESIDFEKPTQKLLVRTPERNLYLPRDKDTQALYDLIYADGDYKTS